MIVFQGKGLLLPIFIIVSLVVSIIAFKMLEENGIMEIPGDGMGFVAGIALILSGVWPWLAKDTYVKINGEKKVLDDVPNTFFFIPLRYWSFILGLLGLILLVRLFFI